MFKSLPMVGPAVAGGSFTDGIGSAAAAAAGGATAGGGVKGRTILNALTNTGSAPEADWGRATGAGAWAGRAAVAKACAKTLDLGRGWGSRCV